MKKYEKIGFCYLVYPLNYLGEPTFVICTSKKEAEELRNKQEERDPYGVYLYKKVSIVKKS